MRSKGYCIGHYDRLRKNGDLRADLPLDRSMWTDEQKKQYSLTISRAKKGQTYIRHAKSYKRPNASGEKHWNWKGSKGSERHAIMQRAEYKLWRSAVFARDDYTCVMCYQKGGTLHADHIKSWSEYPELRLDQANGRTLCMGCHYFVTFKRKIPAGIVWAKTSGVFA